MKTLETYSQHLERFLATSGGKLNFIKCGYYVMLWNFNQEVNETLQSSQNIPNMFLSLKLPVSTSEMKKIDCQKNHVTLGVPVAPSLQMRDAY